MVTPMVCRNRPRTEITEARQVALLTSGAATREGLMKQALIVVIVWAISGSAAARGQGPTERESSAVGS